MLWFFFALLLPGSGQRLRVRQVGRMKGWLDDPNWNSIVRFTCVEQEITTTNVEDISEKFTHSREGRHLTDGQL